MKNLSIALISLIFAGCAGLKPPKATIPIAEKKEFPAFKLVSDSTTVQLTDLFDKGSFIKAAETNLVYLNTLSDKKRFYQIGQRRVTPQLLAQSTKELLRILKDSKDPQELDGLVKENFEIYQMTGVDGNGIVTFSSYYEPVLEASLKKTEEYKYPIYAKPPDMVDINLEDFNDKWKGEKLTGRLKDGRLVPYFTRDEIDFQKILDGKGLELAWFKDRADIMDLHIEGSGRLKLPDGKQVLAKFAATNSHKFKGWMTTLVETGAIPKDEMSHARAKQYLLTHPETERFVLTANRRYTFFKLEDIKDPELGPIGTIGYPLVGGRSVAIDNTIAPMGVPAFLSVNMPDVDKDNKLLGLSPNSRFIFCQDTGGAIKGPNRIDFFAGTGPRALTFAANLWEPGKFYILLLKTKEEDKF